MDELDIISRFFPWGDVPSDDCFHFEDKYLVTTDVMVEDTHFRHAWSSPASLAIKLVEVNLSDIVASGGKPRFALLQLGLSSQVANSHWVGEFARVLLRECRKYGISLRGGDTFRAQATVLGMTLFGETQDYMARHASRLGDSVYLLGSLGLSLWGYELLLQQKKPQKRLETLAICRHLRPRSCYRAMHRLYSAFSVNAAMDITDGLLQDLQKFTQASGLAMRIHVEKLPEYDTLAQYLPLEKILTSGEELSIVFTSPDEIPDLYQGLEVKKIGKVIENPIKSLVEFVLYEKPVWVKESGFIHFPGGKKQR
ncbi:MAG: thiamine-phosphate kinase [Spirochaetota bacterium]